MRLIDWTSSLQVTSCFARINAIAMDAALEETRAAITAVNAVVLARRSVAAHFTRNIQKAITWAFGIAIVIVVTNVIVIVIGVGVVVVVIVVGMGVKNTKNMKGKNHKKIGFIN